MSNRSVLGWDIYKLAVMARSNLGLIRDMLTNPAECTSVFSLLYHEGKEISLFIYYFHGQNLYFHLMGKFDLSLAKDRYLLVHRLMGVESASPQLTVNEMKTTDVWSRLMGIGFGLVKKRVASGQARLSTPKKPRNDNDDFISAIPAAADESIEKQKLDISPSDRDFLNRHGYAFETFSSEPGHVDKGKRRDNNRLVICKKIVYPSELKYLRMLNSEVLRRDSRNFSAELLEWFDRGESCLIIMPCYAPLHRGPFTLSTFNQLPQMLDRFTQQLRDYVSFLHDNHLAHLDIKPQNLATDGQNLVVIDFGLMIEAEADTMMKEIVGTADFLPPDYARGRRRYTAFELDNFATERTIEMLQRMAAEMNS